MDTIKLTKKDQRILEVLDRNPTITYSQLGDEVGVSTQVAKYRVNRMLEQGTIYSFYTAIDPGKLGYQLFRVHIQVQDLDERGYRQLAADFFNEHPMLWVAFVSGPFDIIADIWAKTPQQFESRFRKVVEENKDSIRRFEISPILEVNMYPYGFFLDGNPSSGQKIQLFRKEEPVNLDETGWQILNAIKEDARKPYREVAENTELTRNGVKYRIKKMEEQGVIAGYKMMVDFRHFDRKTYKVFIRYDTACIEQEDELLRYLRNRPGIFVTTKRLGTWNLDIEILPQNAVQLQQFLIEIRNRFDLIQDFDFVQILEDYGIDYLSDNLR